MGWKHNVLKPCLLIPMIHRIDTNKWNIFDWKAIEVRVDSQRVQSDSKRKGHQWKTTFLDHQRRADRPLYSGRSALLWWSKKVVFHWWPFLLLSDWTRWESTLTSIAFQSNIFHLLVSILWIIGMSKHGLRTLCFQPMLAVAHLIRKRNTDEHCNCRRVVCRDSCGYLSSPIERPADNYNVHLYSSFLLSVRLPTWAESTMFLNHVYSFLWSIAA